MHEAFHEAFLLIFGSAFTARISAGQDTRVVYLLGTIVLIATASIRIRWLLFDKRRATLGSAVANDSLAACGLFAETDADAASGRFRCFHCEAVVTFGAFNSAPPDEVWAAHSSASPACYLARLGLLVLSDESAGVADTAAIQADARRFQTVLRRLRMVLEAPVVYAAAEYGYETTYLRLCAARHFMRNDCATVDKAGDLLLLAQEFEELLPPDGPVRGVDLLRMLEAAGIGGSALASSSSDPQPPPQSRYPAVATTRPAVGAISADSLYRTDTDTLAATAVADMDDHCVLCQTRTRNRVTLPCAHFLLCDRCCESQSQCPRCSKTIIATVTAFIT